MAIFVTLINFTEKGVATIKDSPSRLDAARQALKELGGEMKDFYLTMGGYDAVAPSSRCQAMKWRRALRS